MILIRKHLINPITVGERLSFSGQCLMGKGRHRVPRLVRHQHINFDGLDARPERWLILGSLTDDHRRSENQRDSTTARPVRQHHHFMQLQAMATEPYHQRTGEATGPLAHGCHVTA